VTKDPTSNSTPADSGGASTLDLSGRCVGSSYILVRPIGQGATGTVWRGVDRASGEPVAVKLLHESLLRQPKLVTRFVQERTILMMLRHRNVVRVRDLFSVGESLALVMDLVAGGSLREHLRVHHTVPAGEAARLAAQVAAALAEAHELGIVHRDLKPDNILLLTEEGRLETRLTDFGIARVLNTPSLTTPNAVVGTPHYMSPEAFHGAAASPAADVYALGVLLYELVSGRPPYDGDNVADLMRRHLEADLERRPGIPDPLWALIRGCMAPKPRLRPTAAELIAELSAVARTAATAPALPRPKRPEPPEPPEQRETSDSSATSAPPATSERPATPAPAATTEPPATPGPIVKAPDDHPSVVVPIPRKPPRNQVPRWRWSRPGATVALIAGAMLASGVATTAWHLGRADGFVAQPAISASHLPSPSIPGQPGPSSAAPSAKVALPVTRTLPQVRATPPTTATPPRTSTPLPEAKPVGPWQCQPTFAIGFGMSPVIASPCQALGSKIQMKATLAAPAGGNADVALTLQDAITGQPAGTAKTCVGLTFADRDTTAQQCGVATVSAPRGRSYVVVMTWTYTNGGGTARGSAKGKVFSW
jgi:serine/threonine-protein kinase